MASIGVDSIRKRFSRHTALDGVNLEVRDREFVVILGPSGCGKTTLLNVIAGLEHPDEGTITIDDSRVNDLSPGERDLGFVFQSYALYPSKTVRGNLAFALKFRTLPTDGAMSRRDFVEKRIREVAVLLRIEALLDRYPAELSGGQRQRVAMGRALVRHPKAFLFDEPLSNLDAMLRIAVRQEIHDLHQELRATMIYVTHDQTEAMSLGERIVVMNEGRILEVGRPQDIYDRPEWLFTARFVGTPPMNLLDGRLIDESGRVVVRIGDTHVALPDIVAARYRFALERPVIFGIRPEDIDLVDRFASSSKLRASLVGSEFQGSTWLIHANTAGTRVVLTSDRAVSERQADLFLDMTRFHLFDSATGGVIHAEA